MYTRYTTKMIAPFQRLPYWRTALRHVCGNFDIICNAEEEFEGNIFTCTVGGVKFVEITTNAQRLVSIPKLNDSKNRDTSYLIKQVRGSSVIRQNNKSISLNAQDITLINPHVQTTYSFEDRATLLMVMLPKHSLINKFNGREVVYFSNLNGSTGLGAILSEFISSLFKYHSIFSCEEAAALRDTILSMLPHATHRMVKYEKDVALSPLNSALLTHIEQYIEAHLSDPALGPEVIASHCCISVRHLHRVFSETGNTINHWIRRMRLEKGAKDLENPKSLNLSITEIAMRWGFNDSSYFARVFKSAFDMTPKQYRLAQTKTHEKFGQVQFAELVKLKLDYPSTKGLAMPSA